MATTLKERQSLGIHGLLPPNFITQDDQVERCMRHLSAKPNDLEKYIYLCSLQVEYSRECIVYSVYCIVVYTLLCIVLKLCSLGTWIFASILFVFRVYSPVSVTSTASQHQQQDTVILPYKSLVSSYLKFTQLHRRNCFLQSHIKHCSCTQ